MSERPHIDSWLPGTFIPGLVSVIIPTYNRAELLVETVRSVFRQTRRPLQVIVADDGSTDDTPQRIEMLQAECPEGTELLGSPGAKAGACVARNRGAAASCGEFLMFLDSDDLLTAPALEQLVESIKGVDLAWGAWRDLRIDEHACTLSAPVRRSFSEDWLADLLRGEWLATCAVLYRRDALRRIEGWREDVVMESDFHFNVQLGIAGISQAGRSDVVSYYRRGHPGQLSERSYAAKMEQTRLVLQLAERSLDAKGGWTPVRRAAVAARYFHSARMLLYHTGDFEGFERLLIEAKRVDPAFKPPKSWYRWIATMAGFRNAERVAAVGRKLFR